MEHAIQLFAIKGIESTSIQEITEHCGISKGAFYLSFTSKDELIAYIIDYFMQQITLEIDRVVKNNQNPQTKLYNYYFTSLNVLAKNISFTKTFIKEQLSSINGDFISKMNFYDNLINQSILQLLDELYGSSILATKYDILLSMKGFIQAYSQLLFCEQMTFNFDQLATSLVEKTNILAKYSTVTFLKETSFINFLQSPSQNIALQQIQQEIDELKSHTITPLEMETLTILQEQLHSENPSPAIISGMINNLTNNPTYQWLIYIINSYYQK